MLVKATEMVTQGRTSLIIAHRLSTIKNASRIMVMERGKIIEEGNHQTLLALKGVYSHLYNIQFRVMEAQDSGS
ncbi:MAG: hypothetical protein R2847_11925 [Bacteroidia bacterium]